MQVDATSGDLHRLVGEAAHVVPAPVADTANVRTDPPSPTSPEPIEPEPSRWWRRTAATMVYVDETYRLLPGPAKAVLWLIPIVIYRTLGVEFLPWTC